MTHAARAVTATSASEELANLRKRCDSQQDGLRKAYDICSNLLQRVNNAAARIDSRVDAVNDDVTAIYDATKALLLNTEEGALARAQETLAQVTELHGRVMSLVEPQNRLKYEELWKRIQTVSDLAQKHDTQLLEVDGDLRKLLPLIPRVRDHTQDMLALWVHLRDALDVVDHGWRDVYGVPSTENLSPRYIHPCSVVIANWCSPAGGVT
jgi:chromosome segregation ATPase